MQGGECEAERSALFASLDHAVLEQVRFLMDGDAERIDGLLDGARGDCVAAVRRLRSATATGDLETSRSAAHFLVGLCGSLGMAELAERWRQAERAPKPVDVGAIERFERQWESAIATLGAFLRSPELSASPADPSSAPQSGDR